MANEKLGPFVSKQRVHFDMIDQMGIVHNAAYLLLFERARTDYWQSLGVGYGAPGLDWPYLVARNEINYRAALTTDQITEVTVAVSRLGSTSVTFAHEIYDAQGKLCADGGTVIVRVHPDTWRPFPWSKEFHRLVAAIRTDL
jgi:acyl-CoA thioester hydrolase